MKHLATIILILAANVSIAQKLYLDSIFSEINKTTYSFPTDSDEILQFDFYSRSNPKEKAPLLVYVHGGGFSGGARDDDDIVDFAIKIAERGYSVASVSYRLTMKGIGFGCDVDASKKIAAIDAASFDVNQAVKYILDNDTKFMIDSTKIILAGGSAGAEAVLNLAYVYENNTLPKDFKFAGVISMAGALTTIDKIDSATAIPTQLFHGTGDPLVPYDIAPHHYCDSNNTGYLMLYGSNAIAKRLHGLGKSYYLYTSNGGSHDWADIPRVKCINEVVDFLYHDVVNIDAIRQTSRTINR